RGGAVAAVAAEVDRGGQLAPLGLRRRLHDRVVLAVLLAAVVAHVGVDPLDVRARPPDVVRGERPLRAVDGVGAARLAVVERRLVAALLHAGAVVAALLGAGAVGGGARIVALVAGADVRIGRAPALDRAGR